MKGSKIGAYAALLLGVVFATHGLYGLVILPGQGISSVDDFTNPAKLLAYMNNQPVLFSINNLIIIIIAPILLVLALAIYERLRADSPNLMRIATNSAVVGTALFLAAGMIRIYALPQLLSAYAKNQAGFASAVQAARYLEIALGAAAIFAFGWWVLLTSWAALKKGWLPQILNYIGLLVGALAIVTFLFPGLPVYGLVSAPGAVWSLWLGFSLWQEK